MTPTERAKELAERLQTNFEGWIFSDATRADAVESVCAAFLALLAEREPVEIAKDEDGCIGVCPKCGEDVHGGNFCGNCGRGLKWKE